MTCTSPGRYRVTTPAALEAFQESRRDRTSLVVEDDDSVLAVGEEASLGR